MGDLELVRRFDSSVNNKLYRQDTSIDPMVTKPGMQSFY